jgi:hypothetical protein
MNPPILRSLVPGAIAAVGPMAEPGEIAPVQPLLTIETLIAYLRSVDPHTENNRTWADFVVDYEIVDEALLRRCADALAAGRNKVRARASLSRRASGARDLEPTTKPRRDAWQLRLCFES